MRAEQAGATQGYPMLALEKGGSANILAGRSPGCGEGGQCSPNAPRPPPIYLRTHLESGARQPFHVERSGGHELHTAPRRRRLLDRRRAGVSPRGGCPPAPDGLPPGPHGSRTTPLGPTDGASLGENPAEFRCGESRFPRRRLSPDAPVPTVQAEVSYFNRLLTLTRHRTARGPKGWCSCHEPSRLRTGE